MEALLDNPNEAFSVEKTKQVRILVYGPRVDRMLGYTNLESEKGFVSFFQRFLCQTGILDELKALGIEEGDTARAMNILNLTIMIKTAP